MTTSKCFSYGFRTSYSVLNVALNAVASVFFAMPGIIDTEKKGDGCPLFLFSQRDDRIDARRPSRGQRASDHGDDGQDRRDRRQNPRIAGADGEQLALEALAQHERA